MLAKVRISANELLAAPFTEGQWKRYDQCLLEISDQEGMVVAAFALHRNGEFLAEYLENTNRSPDLPELCAAYDQYCDRIKGKDGSKAIQQRAAMLRLQYPLGLSDKFRTIYWRYLLHYKQEILKELLAARDLQWVFDLPKVFLTPRSASKTIELVRSAGQEALASFLVEFSKGHLRRPPELPAPKRHRAAPAKPYVPRSTDAFSQRRVQKQWLLGRVRESELAVRGYRGAWQKVLTLPSRAGTKPITIVGHKFRFPNWDDKEIVIPEGYVGIEGYAFSHRMDLVRVQLPNTLTIIGPRAFWHCEQLSELQLGPALTALGSEAFAKCRSLRKICIPAGVTVIPEKAFRGCDMLEEVEIEPGVREIGNLAFARCPRLAVIHLPDTLRKISPTAFDTQPFPIITIDPPNSPFVFKHGALIRLEDERAPA